MAAFSGKSGWIKLSTAEVLHVTRWSLTDRCKLVPWSSTDTAGFMSRSRSVWDASGEFEFKLDNTSPQWESGGGLLSTGLIATAIFYFDDATRFLTVPILVEEVSYEVDIDNGGVITGRATWQLNGSWSYPSTGDWSGS